MSICLWIDEGMEEAREEMKKNAEKKENDVRCACGRKVCCGKHKNGQCSYHKKERERD